jgi:hypothetical protein
VSSTLIDSARPLSLKLTQSSSSSFVFALLAGLIDGVDYIRTRYKHPHMADTQETSTGSSKHHSTTGKQKCLALKHALFVKKLN